MKGFSKKGDETMKKPLVVHKDRTVYLHEWLDADGRVGQKLTDFADIIQAPEEVNTFRLSPYALWSAASKNIKADDIIEWLQSYSLNRISEYLKGEIRRNIEEFNTVKLIKENGNLLLIAINKIVIEKLKNDRQIASRIIKQPSQTSLLFNIIDRIAIKKQLFKLELFAVDSSTQCLGEVLELQLKEEAANGQFELRKYQKEAVDRFRKFSLSVGGGGVIIMPPESGKTLVGLKLIETLKTSTLVLVENPGSAVSWAEEIRDKTDLAPESYTILSNKFFQAKPITICTYKNATENQVKLDFLESQNWGLIIYDDAHKLPAEKYVLTTNISSKYKLALAATVARSDEKGTIVFEMIGPKWYEVLPRTLESEGFLKPIRCIEVKIPLSESDREKYLNDSSPQIHREIANLNLLKLEALEYIRRYHWADNLVVVSFRRNLASIISKKMNTAIIHSTNLSPEQEQLIKDFNTGRIKELLTTSVVEQLKVKMLDVLVATSYQQGSEREEYLRVGKVSGTKSMAKTGYMYALVTINSIEEEDYARRRKKLINYGYRYLPLTLEELTQGRITL